MKNLNLIRLFVLFVGISGAFSVLFGAWFAHAGHALSAIDNNRIESAQFYQFIHTLALVVIIVWYIVVPSKWLLCSSSCFSVGVLCFSGSLYIKTFFAMSTIGKLAPVGGILLAIGWLFIIFASKATIEHLVAKSAQKNIIHK